MSGKYFLTVVATSAGFIILIAILVAAAVEQAPLLIADGLESIADAYLESFRENSMTRWLNEDYMILSQYEETDYRYYYLGVSVSFFFYNDNGVSIVPDQNWDEYMECFNAENETDAFEAVQNNYGYQMSRDDQPMILGFAAELNRMNNSNENSNGGIYTIENVTVDFGSKYYTYSSDKAKGNPCVCDDNNSVAWPYNGCIALSYFHEFNKMICSSYAAGRYWEVNYPDDPFPLPFNWDSLITLQKQSPGNGLFSTDISHPISQAIISIHHAGGNHDAFIESVSADGSVIVSECNASSERPYGFRVRKFVSLQEFLDSYGSGTYLNGMYGK